jgi:hypothetical protein
MSYEFVCVSQFIIYTSYFYYLCAIQSIEYFCRYKLNVLII